MKTPGDNSLEFPGNLGAFKTLNSLTFRVKTSRVSTKTWEIRRLITTLKPLSSKTKIPSYGPVDNCTIIL